MKFPSWNGSTRRSGRHDLQAIACYLAIPVVVVSSGFLFSLIDPELARGHADYVRNFRLLTQVRIGVQVAMAGLAMALWIGVCHLTLKSRKRSAGWLWLAAGPIGLAVIAMLRDRAPAPEDLYQRFIGRLKLYQRVLLETGLFVSVWMAAFALVELSVDLMIQCESFVTGTPVATIVDIRNASSGMYAFGEGLEAMYVVVLIYLLWPLGFNAAGRLIKARAGGMRRDPGYPVR
jgi:hypothetical protein